MAKKKTKTVAKTKAKETVKTNETLMYIVIAAVILIILMCVFWIGNRGTYSLDNEDRIELICPTGTYGAGDEVICNIKLYSPITTTLSVNANYDLPEGVSYVAFGAVPNCAYAESCFSVFAATENGFAVGNVNGWHHEGAGLLIGSVKFALGDEVESDSSYTIGLTNIELSDSEFEMHELDDVTASIATKSSNANISGMIITFAKCSGGGCTNVDATVPQFNSEVTEYDIEVSADAGRMDFRIAKEHENSTVSVNGLPFINYIDCNGQYYAPEEEPENCGDPHNARGNVNLHYGTNTIELVVTADNGVATKTYTYTVVRDYVFNPSVYIYDETDNYLYTSGDTGNAILASLGAPDEGLTYSINNNKLEIKYGQELLKSINIVHFNMDYNYDYNNIYLYNGVTLSQFMSHVSGEGLTFKVFDGDTEITDEDAILTNGYFVKIYYGSRNVEEFEIVIAAMSFDDDIVVDRTNMILRRIPIGSTVEWLKDKIQTSGTVVVLDKTGEAESSDDEVLKTGDKLVIILADDNEAEYTISVLGDVLGNGQIKINDVGAAYGYLKGRKELTLAQQFAGNVIYSDEVIKINDVGKLYGYVKGTVDSFDLEG